MECIQTAQCLSCTQLLWGEQWKTWTEVQQTPTSNTPNQNPLAQFLVSVRIGMIHRVPQSPVCSPLKVNEIHYLKCCVEFSTFRNKSTILNFLYIFIYGWGSPGGCRNPLLSLVISIIAKVCTQGRKCPNVFEYWKLFLQLHRWYKLLDALDLVKNLPQVHSNHIKNDSLLEHSFPVPLVYLLSHTLIYCWCR